MVIKNGIHFVLALVNVLTLWAMLVAGHEIHPDTGPYLDNALFRAPLLPILLDLFELTFGSHFLEVFSRFQSLFSTACIGTLAYFLFRYAKLSKILAHGVFTFLLVVQYVIGNGILTEPMAAGFHALFIAFLVAHIATLSQKHLFGMISIAGVELLLRPQFFFVFVFLLGYTIIMLIKGKNKTYLVACISILILWVGLSFLRNTYNYVYSGVFNNYSTIGEHLFVTQIYISSPNDLALFTDSNEIAFLKAMYSRIEENKLSMKYWKTGKSHYDMAIEEIYFNHMFAAYHSIFPEKGPRQDLARDAFCKRIGIKLMVNNPYQYLKLLFRKVYSGPFMYLSLLVALFCLTGLWYWHSDDSNALLYLSITSMSLLKYGMLIPFAIIADRYTMLNDAYQILFTILCGTSLLSPLYGWTSKFSTLFPETNKVKA